MKLNREQRRALARKVRRVAAHPDREDTIEKKLDVAIKQTNKAVLKGLTLSEAAKL